jgi:hypothetical protein
MFVDRSPHWQVKGFGVCCRVERQFAACRGEVRSLIETVFVVADATRTVAGNAVVL